MCGKTNYPLITETPKGGNSWPRAIQEVSMLNTYTNKHIYANPSVVCWEKCRSFSPLVYILFGEV